MNMPQITIKIFTRRRNSQEGMEDSGALSISITLSLAIPHAIAVPAPARINTSPDVDAASIIISGMSFNFTLLFMQNARNAL